MLLLHTKYKVINHNSEKQLNPHEVSTSTSKWSPSSLTTTFATSPLLIVPRIILSASVLPTSFEINLFSGLAPYLGWYPLSQSQALTLSDTDSVILRSSSLACSSFNLMSTISLKASRERRLKTMN